MKRFDKRLKKQLKREAPKMPAQAEEVFDKAINKIRAEQIKRKRRFAAYVALTAIAAVIFLFLNFRTGLFDEERNIIKESDACGAKPAEEDRQIAEKSQIEEKPQIEEKLQIEEIESIRVGMIDYRNPEIRQYIDMILTQFKKDRKESQKSSAIDYEVLTNTERWFTLCLTVQEERAGTVYYYNVDKGSKCIVQLSDLFVGGFDYVGVFSEEIKKQMKEEIESEGDKKYWVDSDMEGEFYKIDRNQEFYFNQKGNLVIVLRKGEAAPEEIGSLRFVIEKGVFETALK